MWSFLTGKLAGPLFGIGTLVLAVVAGLQQAHILSLKTENASLHDSIENPTTGYIVQLGRAKDSEATYKMGLQACNVGVDGLKVEGDRITKYANDALALARAAGDERRKQSAAILAAKPTSGADLCAETDRLILGSVTP
jgi:hypothetical protein